jgi:hypothetical protein
MRPDNKLVKKTVMIIMMISVRVYGGPNDRTSRGAREVFGCVIVSFIRARGSHHCPSATREELRPSTASPSLWLSPFLMNGLTDAAHSTGAASGVLRTEMDPRDKVRFPVGANRICICKI